MAIAWRNPAHYAVYAGKIGTVWLNDFGFIAFVCFDPSQVRFETLTLPNPGSEVSQIQVGSTGEVWEAWSGTDRLVVIRTADQLNDL